MNDKTLYDCRKLYIKPKMGYKVNSLFSLSQVSTLPYTFNTTWIKSIFFSRGPAPIAPKGDGGYYMAYYNSIDKNMHCVEFDKDDKIIRNQSLGISAQPYDIIETEYGFGIFARTVADTTHGFIVTFNKDFKLRQKTSLLNGDKSEYGNGYLIFYNQKGDPLYGLTEMLEPNNGKLCYGRGKLNLIFAHYNNFGATGNHTGDTYYIFDDTAKPENAKYSWEWGASHSLIQSHIYDGRYFVTASLGDEGPRGIKIDVIDTEQLTTNKDGKRNDYVNYKHYYATKTVIDEFMGNGGGNSIGRLGGLHVLDTYVYGVVYSVKKYKTKTVNEERNGIYLTKVFFDKINGKLKLKSTVTIMENVAGGIHNVRSAKYGNNLLITYNVDKDGDFAIDKYPNAYYQLTEKMYYIYVSNEGKVLAGPFQESENKMVINEDIRELKDGSLRWGYCDNKGVMRIMKVNLDHKSNELEEGGGFPTWAIVLIVVMVLLVIGFFVFHFLSKKGIVNIEEKFAPLFNKA